MRSLVCDHWFKLFLITFIHHRYGSNNKKERQQGNIELKKKKKPKSTPATVYTLDNLSLRVGMISLGNLNPQYVWHSFTMFFMPSAVQRKIMTYKVILTMML